MSKITAHSLINNNGISWGADIELYRIYLGDHADKFHEFYDEIYMMSIFDGSLNLKVEDGQIHVWWYATEDWSNEYAFNLIKCMGCGHIGRGAADVWSISFSLSDPNSISECNRVINKVLGLYNDRS